MDELTETARDREHMAWQLRVLAAMGIRLAAGATVLDFGCGSGGLVAAFENAGFRAYGCDVVLDRESEQLRVIADPYRLPFEDRCFDLVCSNQVFEHVQNPDAAFAEIARVLRPGGATLHLFPARYNPIEPHTYVPLATIVRNRIWLRLWATLGVRNDFQKGKPAAEVAELNHQYLLNSTRYLRRGEIVEIAARHLGRVEFVEHVSLAVSPGRGRHVAPWVSHLPILARVYSAMRARAILLREPTTKSG